MYMYNRTDPWRTGTGDGVKSVKLVISPPLFKVQGVQNNY